VDGGSPRCSAAVPAEARLCPACGAALHDLALEESKLVTALFADITGSTRLGVRFDTERWRVLLQGWFYVSPSRRWKAPDRTPRLSGDLD
jgi:class 3 adenylate cyclase